MAAVTWLLVPSLLVAAVLPVSPFSVNLGASSHHQLRTHKKNILRASARLFERLPGKWTLCCALPTELAEELSNEEISRYSRHLVLGDVGVTGQKNLKNSSVLVIG